MINNASLLDKMSAQDYAEYYLYLIIFFSAGGERNMLLQAIDDILEDINKKACLV